MANALRKETTQRLGRTGNSTGLTLPRELLDTLGLERGDTVTLIADGATGTLTVRKVDDTHSRYMRAAREGSERYRRTLAALAQ